MSPVEVGAATHPQLVLPGNIFRPKNPLSASDGGRDPIDPVAAGYNDDSNDGSNNVVLFDDLAVGVAVM
jgi:hypothetical protein